MATIPSDSRLRQIAILIASVDADAARHILLNLPSEIARKVRSMAAEIGPIPAEERRSLMTELQRVQRQGKAPSPGLSSGTDSDISSAQSSSQDADSIQNSLAARLLGSDGGETAAKFWTGFSHSPSSVHESAYSDLVSRASPSPDAPAWTQLSIDALVRFIRHERPVVIAVILQQLQASQAAAALQRLPRSMGREVLNRLGSLQNVDPEAMQAIDEHLSQRLSDYRHKIETELENTRKINALLAAAPPELKQQWASWLQPENDSEKQSSNEAAEALKTLSETTLDGMRTMAARPQATGRQDSATGESPHATPHVRLYAPDDDFSNVVPGQGRTSSSIAARPISPIDRARLQIDFERILTLRMDQLASMLSNLDSRTVLLALAGATPKFIKQFYAMLKPADAKALDVRVRGIGPVHLRDIDEAQQRIIDAYWALSTLSAGRRAA